MKNALISSALLLASLSFGGAAYACDMHGGAGYGGFSLRGAPWAPYNPQVSTTDPALAAKELITPLTSDTVPPVKTRPSFSNVANMAAMKAKARLAKKSDSEKPSKKAGVKKTALNADR